MMIKYTSLVGVLQFFMLSSVWGYTYDLRSVYIKSYRNYHYLTPLDFVEELSRVVAGVEALTKSLWIDITQDIDDILKFNMRSKDPKLNLFVANTMNGMLITQVIVDMHVYKVKYCMGAFRNTKDFIIDIPNQNPLYATFRFPMDTTRMIAYNWAELARREFMEAYTMAMGFREKWEDLKRQVASTAVPLITPKVGLAQKMMSNKRKTNLKSDEDNASAGAITKTESDDQETKGNR